MDPDRFAQVKRLVLALEAMPPADRAAWLDRACGGDPSLREDVASLMADDVPSIMQTDGLASRIVRMGLGRDPVDQMIGPYRILDVLGEGGMGIVYRAVQTAPFHREVALKLVPPGLDTARVVSRFESERQALARMSHPYIAQVYDAGAGDDGRPYFAMELVDGEPVTEYCAREQPPLDTRLRLFLQICEAVQHAHQRGIIHRDLKPSNVLLTRRGADLIPKVIDFGIAKAIGDAENLALLTTADGHIVGTPEYMSPEQAGLIDAGLDTRTDVYSLGVMLYELVSGRRPYELARRTPLELDRVMRTPATPPSQLGGTVPHGTVTGQTARDIDAVALMAIERDPDDRYASVEQLAEDVRRACEHRPVRARTQTWTYRAERFVRRNAAVVATSGLVAALVIAGALGIVSQRNRALASERLAVDEAARAKAEAAKATAVSGFLIDLFRESDPARARGASLTARELLDRGAARLTTELASQDAVRATLMDTIGVVYRMLGMTDESEKITTDALAIRRRTLGPEHPDIAASLDNLGQIARERTRYDQAAQYHREALTMRRATLDARDPSVAASLSNLGLALREQGKYEEAEAAVREALEIRRAVLGPEHADTLTSMNVLGDIKDSSGDLVEGARWYREVLDARQRTLPENHPLIANSLHNVAGSLARAGKLADAEPLMRQALAIRQRIFDPGHPDITASMSDLASTLHDLGRLDDAEPLYREVIALDRERNGREHMDVAIGLNNLASLLDDRGQLEEAATLYDESRAIRVALQGEIHPSVGTILNNLGRTRLMQGRLDEAERALRRAIDIRLALKMSDHPRHATTIMWLGRVEEARGRLTAARQHYQAALAIERKASPSGSPSLAAILSNLGHVMVRQKEAAAAEPLLREALAFRRQSLPAGHRATGDAEAGLADALLRLARRDEVEALLLSALRTAPTGPTPLLYKRPAVLEMIIGHYEAVGRTTDASRYRAQLKAG